MKCYVIYDETGSVYAVRYGKDQVIPEKIQGIFQEIPDGGLITGVDVSDLENHNILFTPPKESALEKEIIRLNAQVAYLSMMSGIEMETDNE